MVIADNCLSIQAIDKRTSAAAAAAANLPSFWLLASCCLVKEKAKAKAKNNSVPHALGQTCACVPTEQNQRTETDDMSPDFAATAAAAANVITLSSKSCC